MVKSKFLLLQSNTIAIYSLYDLEQLDNVVTFHRKNVTSNKILNLLFNIHNSGKIRRYIRLPFKAVWDKIIFNNLLRSFMPDYIIIAPFWYSNHLLSYFRKKCSKSRIILRFTDKVVNGLYTDRDSYIEQIRKQFDGVLVYSQEDAERYKFTYHSVGYSAINKKLLKPCKSYDVVFVGAEKGRMDKIRQAYNRFKNAGLSCFFYVTMVKKEDREDDGIVYADNIMPFIEYISYELAAKCLFEIVQEGSSGRTFRMMESIMYNKLLVTNSTEILRTDYYRPEYVQLYEDVTDIDPSFIVSYQDTIDYNYKGDFSPKYVLEFVERVW